MNRVLVFCAYAAMVLLVMPATIAGTAVALRLLGAEYTLEHEAAAMARRIEASIRAAPPGNVIVGRCDITMEDTIAGFVADDAHTRCSSHSSQQMPITEAAFMVTRQLRGLYGAAVIWSLALVVLWVSLRRWWRQQTAQVEQVFSVGSAEPPDIAGDTRPDGMKG